MFYGTEMRVGPWFGVQWTDTMPPHATIDYYTWVGSCLDWAQ